MVGARFEVGDKARTDGKLTIESGLLGTPAYMAPEQVEGRPANPASDI